MPFNRVAFIGVSQLSLSVRDLMTSVGWYRAVLGLQEVDYREGHGWTAVVMIHEPSSTVIELRRYEADQAGAFEPGRTGVDHLGFGVATREALEDWQEHFIRISVDHTPITEGEQGAVLGFRDPDGIQLEMVYRPAHP